MLLATVDARELVPDGISRYLSEVATSGQTTVDILGRYQHDHDLVPATTPPGVACTFRTIHGSKGLEADHVIIANAMSGRYGFPSQIESDPILDLAMVDPDNFPYSEERRLMYVALTRARRAVLIVTLRGHESAFVAELVADGLVSPYGEDDTPAPRACPTCRKGVLTERNGRYGAFLGCSRFPACRHTQKVD